MVSDGFLEIDRPFLGLLVTANICSGRSMYTNHLPQARFPFCCSASALERPWRPRACFSPAAISNNILKNPAFVQGTDLQRPESHNSVRLQTAIAEHALTACYRTSHAQSRVRAKSKCSKLKGRSVGQIIVRAESYISGQYHTLPTGSVV
jgi:hypothetical protein